MIDYLGLEGDLGEEERMVRDTARDFVENEVKPDVGQHWIDGTFPTDLITEMGELGFYAPNLDGYGLPGLSETATASCYRNWRPATAACARWPAFRVRSSCTRFTPTAAMPEGGVVAGARQRRAGGCFGLTEPEHGSNPSAMETTAERDADGYVLNGSKTWITNAPISDLAVVWAKVTSADGDPVRGFLVETDRDGVTTNKIDEKLSLRASITGEISLQNARVPEENVLPGVEGMKGPLSCLTQARYGIAWGTVGAAMDCFETAHEYATDREQFGKPIAGYQLQQEKLAEMATQISLGQLLAHRLADLKERGDLRPEQVSMAKRNNARMAREQSRVAREMLGGNGITADYSPMRHLTNLETVYTYEGTHDIHSLILGHDLTGIPAFE